MKVSEKTDTDRANFNRPSQQGTPIKKKALQKFYFAYGDLEIITDNRL